MAIHKLKNSNNQEFTFTGVASDIEKANRFIAESEKNGYKVSDGISGTMNYLKYLNKATSNIYNHGNPNNMP